MKIDINQIFSTLGPSCIGSNPVTVPPDCSSWTVIENSFAKTLRLQLTTNGCVNTYEWTYTKAGVWNNTILPLLVNTALDACTGGFKPVLNIPDNVSNLDIPLIYTVVQDCCDDAGTSNTYTFRIHDRTTATLTKVDGTVLCLDVEQGTPFTYKNGSTYSSPTVSINVAKAKSTGGNSLNAFYNLYWQNNSVTSSPVYIKNEASIALPYSLNPLHIGNLNATQLSTLLGTQTSGIIQLKIESGQVSSGVCNSGSCNSLTTLNYQWYKHGNNITTLNPLQCKNTLSTALGNFSFDAIKWETSASDSYANIGWANYNTTNYIHVNGNQIALTNGVVQNVTGSSAGFIAGTANDSENQKPGTYYFYKAVNTNACGTLQEVKKLVYDPQVHAMDVTWVNPTSGQQGYNMFVSLLDTTTLNTLASNSTTKANLVTSINTYKGLFPTISNWSSYAGFMIYLVKPKGVIARSNTWTIAPSVYTNAPNFTQVDYDYTFVSGWQTGVLVKYTNALSVTTCLILPNEKAFVIPIPKTATTNWGNATTRTVAPFAAIPLWVQLSDTCGYFGQGLTQSWPGNIINSSDFIVVKNKNHTL
jgi:hypothetical protein